MVKFTNNWIIISNDDKSYLPLEIYLIKQQPNRTIRLRNGKRIEQHVPDYRYYYKDSNNLYIPIGLLSFVAEFISNSYIVDNRSDSSWLPDIKNVEYYKNILPGIELRDEQVIAIRKAIAIRRGIIQMPTGSGKSEIMCGIVEAIKTGTGNYPTTLILEPTLYLVESMIDRFKEYNIPVVQYNDNRKIINNCVNICHPASLSNDIDKNPNLLDNVSILLGDESHHFNAEQFRKPTYNMPNLVMSIGVSASVISQDHVNYKNIQDYDIKEVLAFSATGPLLMNVITGSMIEENRLADPVLFMMSHIVNEPIPEDDPSIWHNVAKYRLESERRNKLIVDCAEFFSRYNRKSLILVRTIRWSRLLLEEFNKRGMSDIVGASYGGKQYERYDGVNYINDSSIQDKFNEGSIKILIGTTHLYEGVDIPNLDTIILAYGGNGERTQVQGIGRALRLTKTGKYAYIIDFTDNNDPVLSKHSRNRMKRYKDIICVPENHIYENIDIEDMSNIFTSLEEITDVING